MLMMSGDQLNCDTETRYAMIGLGIFGVFGVETDHKPLIFFLVKMIFHFIVQRFKMRLMRYQSQMFHTPATARCLNIADYLSGHSAKGSLDSGFIECRSVERVSCIMCKGALT